jgi:hypothetical protein
VPPLYYSDDDEEGDIENLDSASTQDVLDTYSQTISDVASGNSSQYGRVATLGR